MLTLFILSYLFGTICIGLWASRKVKKAEDFALAGRRLPFHLSMSAFFATWFGAETILGASSRFATYGFKGIIEDPLGATLCLVLVGVVFTKKLYPKGYISIGDFFNEKYGPRFAFISSFIQALSYFSYTSAQFVALALVMQSFLPLSFSICLLAGSFLVVAYTFLGGMWAVAVTDFIQTIVIIIGLAALAIFVSFEYSFQEIPFKLILVDKSSSFLPSTDFSEWGKFIAAWMVMGLGSIPSQDVFQRVMASNSEKTARHSAIWAGCTYLVIAALPIYIVTVCTYHSTPKGDIQQIIPMMVLQHTPFYIQAFFFGALLSAILSTASASLLAQATVIGENLVKPYLASSSDQQMLNTYRILVVLVSFVSIAIGFVFKDIFLLASISSSIVLVTLFIPLIFALNKLRGDTKAAYLSLGCGLIVFLFCFYLELELLAVLWGFMASFVGYVAGLSRHYLKRLKVNPRRLDLLMLPLKRMVRNF